MIIFVLLLGVLSTCGSAEIIPYEPDMYHDSAGKRYGIHYFVGLNWAVNASGYWCFSCHGSLGQRDGIKAFHNRLSKNGIMMK